jgi:hypothetical protein
VKHASTLVLVVLVTLGLGCRTVSREAVEPPQLGFLAGVYDRLEPGEGGEASFRYVAADADWSRYDRILLDPVQYWDDPNGDVSPDVEQLLTTYLHARLKEKLEKGGFPLAALPGPGVLRVQSALFDASAATPILRTASLVVPVGLVINAAQSVATRRFAFSGQLQAAMKVTDAQSGELLAAALDRRSGGAGVRPALQWQWGDAKAAIDFWADRFTERLRELHGKIEAK